MPPVTYTDKEVEDREAIAFENGMQTALKDIEAAKTNIQQLKAEIAALIPDLNHAYDTAWDEQFIGCINKLRQLSAV